jgi:hypothetical protein
MFMLCCESHRAYISYYYMFKKLYRYFSAKILLQFFALNNLFDRYI